MSRENAGYSITDTLKVGDYELVIGERPSAPSPYVCWYCKDGDNYFWGDYCETKSAALQSLCERAIYEQKQVEARHQPPKQKSGEAR